MKALSSTIRWLWMTFWRTLRWLWVEVWAILLGAGLVTIPLYCVDQKLESERSEASKRHFEHRMVEHDRIPTDIIRRASESPSSTHLIRMP